MTEPLGVLNTDHLPPLDLGGKDIDAPQFRVIHDLLNSPHKTDLPLFQGKSMKPKNKKTLLGRAEQGLHSKVWLSREGSSLLRFLKTPSPLVFSAALFKVSMCSSHSCRPQLAPGYPYPSPPVQIGDVRKGIGGIQRHDHCLVTHMGGIGGRGRRNASLPNTALSRKQDHPDVLSPHHKTLIL